MITKNNWTVKELAKHISSHVLSVNSIEYLINQLLKQENKKQNELTKPKSNK